jgi:SAM-dependent methyltransferase
MSSYKDTTYNSRFFLKRWLHNRRFDEALALLDLHKSDFFLDYGCGDAHLLDLCLKLLPPPNLYGFEPANIMYDEALNTIGEKGITLVTNISELQKSFTKISCLETCEHLVHDDLISLLINIRTLLAHNGRVVFSVPIEIGIPALFKNLFRFIKNRDYDNLSFIKYSRTIFCLPVPRNTDQTLGNIPYIYSHIGFNHNTFESTVKTYFTIESKHCSPIHFLGPAFNNTIYYCCRNK